MILTICALLLLTACNQEEEEIEVSRIDEHNEDYASLPLASELIINPNVEGLITMNIEVDGDELVVVVRSLLAIDVRLEHPTPEYFDGLNWRELRIRGEEFFDEVYEIPWLLAGESFTQRIPINILSFPDDLLLNIGVTSYPERGLFRLRRLVPGQGHEVTGEFTLD